MPATNQISTAKSTFKPFVIGPYIKERIAQLHIEPVELGKRVGISAGNIYRIFNQKQMSVKMLLKFSEVLGENLLDNYQPNVPIKPHPYEAEIISLRNENAQLKSRVNREQQLEEENKLLKAQLDILREVIKGK